MLMTDQSQFAKEFLSESAKLGSKKNMLSDVVGMPDDQDKENIRRFILRYEKKHPGYIAHAIAEAKTEQQAAGHNKFGLVDGQSARRHLFELPEELYGDIEQAYPTMFRDKKHFAWFVKNFKELLVPEKY